MRLAQIDADGQRLVASVADGVATPIGTGGQDELVAVAMSGELPTAIGSAIPLENVRLLPPIDRPPSVRDFFAFEEHVKNSRAGQGLDVDPGWYEKPVFYFSNPANIYGMGESIPVPKGSHALDYELELAAVIGTEARDLDPDDPASMDAIAGFTILNDWSARDLQSEEMKQNLGPQKGKDFATSLGPWLVTKDELPEWRSGRPKAWMTARVNGAEKSRGESTTIYFTWMAMLAHASANTRLVPCDVAGSGTVGTGCILEWRMTGHKDTHKWLRPGDDVELEIEHIGVLRNSVTS